MATGDAGALGPAAGKGPNSVDFPVSRRDPFLMIRIETLVDARAHLHCLLGDGRHLDIRFLPEGTGGEGRGGV